MSRTETSPEGQPQTSRRFGTKCGQSKPRRSKQPQRLRVNSTPQKEIILRSRYINRYMLMKWGLQQSELVESYSDPKTLHSEVDLLKSGVVATAAFLVEVSSYLSKPQLRILRQQKKIRVANINSSEVLEQFTGFVDHVDGETAFVTLTSNTGEELLGEYPAAELACLGIHERRRFICKTLTTNGKVEVQFQAIPDRELTAEEEASIDREIDELMAGGNLDGDY